MSLFIGDSIFRNCYEPICQQHDRHTLHTQVYIFVCMNSVGNDQRAFQPLCHVRAKLNPNY